MKAPSTRRWPTSGKPSEPPPNIYRQEEERYEAARLTRGDDPTKGHANVPVRGGAIRSAPRACRRAGPSPDWMMSHERILEYVSPCGKHIRGRGSSRTSMPAGPSRCVSRPAAGRAGPPLARRQGRGWSRWRGGTWAGLLGGSGGWTRVKSGFVFPRLHRSHSLVSGGASRYRPF